MPKLVNSSWFIVNRKTTTTNHQPPTTNRKSKGFTLIELLIVIALIGILSSFGVYGFQSSQKKARDSQRKNDLQVVKKAMEAAKNDCLGGSYYPNNYTNSVQAGMAYMYISTYLVANKYLQASSFDVNQINQYRFERSSKTINLCPDVNGGTTMGGIKTYVLRTQLEITQDPDIVNSFAKCQNLIDSGTITFSSPLPSSDDGYYYVCPD